MKKNLELELKRNIFHLVFGCLLAMLLITVGKDYGLYIFGTFIIVGIMISEMIRMRIKAPIFNLFVGIFGRRKERPGIGAINFIIGAFISLVYFDVTIVFVAILILAFCDSFSAVFGILFGKYKIKKNKTFEGFLAGFLASAIVCMLFIPPYVALIACIVAAVIEVYSFLDDNILITPVAALTITLLM